MSDTLNRVQKIIGDLLGADVGEVTLEARFREELDADSLDLVELIMAFEEEFSDDSTTIEISDEDAESITTVQEAIDYLKSNGVKE